MKQFRFFYPRLPSINTCKEWKRVSYYRIMFEPVARPPVELYNTLIIARRCHLIYYYSIKKDKGARLCP